MWRVEPEKVAGRLCLDGSHANAFGYRQYGCRLEPAQDATLRPHVRMLKCIAWEKFLPFNLKRSKPFCSSACAAFGRSGHEPPLQGTDLRRYDTSF
jgi:hypothetical protein